MRRVKRRRCLKGTFVVITAALWIIWAVNGAGYPWPAWATIFWAIVVVMDAWAVYVRRPITEADVQRDLALLLSRVSQEHSPPGSDAPGGRSPRSAGATRAFRDGSAQPGSAGRSSG